MESNPGRLGGKRECYCCAMPTPKVYLISFLYFPLNLLLIEVVPIFFLAIFQLSLPESFTIYRSCDSWKAIELLFTLFPKIV